LNTLVNFESAQPSKNGQFSVGVNTVPQQLIDMCAFIEHILGEERWQTKLKKQQLLLTEVFSKKIPKDVVEEDDLR